jgi:hypothetical protein
MREQEGFSLGRLVGGGNMWTANDLLILGGSTGVGGCGQVPPVVLAAYLNHPDFLQSIAKVRGTVGKKIEPISPDQPDFYYSPGAAPGCGVSDYWERYTEVRDAKEKFTNGNG